MIKGIYTPIYDDLFSLGLLPYRTLLFSYGIFEILPSKYEVSLKLLKIGSKPRRLFQVNLPFLRHFRD